MNKILEAIQRGIQIALDDYEDNIGVENISPVRAPIEKVNVVSAIVKKVYTNIEHNIIPSTDDLLFVANIDKDIIDKFGKCQVNDKKTLEKVIQAFNNTESEIDLNWLDVSNLTDFTRIFQKLKNVKFDCSEWDTSNVKKFNYVFAFCTKTTVINAGNWTFDSAKELDGMFYTCKANIEIDGEQWNTGNVETMRNMFSGCGSKLLIHANRLDISGCIDFNSMFKNTKYVISSELPFPIIDLSEWCISNQCDIDNMFEDSNIPQNLKPKIVNGSTYSFTPQSGKIDKRKAMQDFKAAINTFIDQTKCKKLNNEVATYNDPIYSGRIIFPDESTGDFQFDIKTGKCDIIYKQQGLSQSGFDLNKLIDIVNSMKF